MPDFDASQRTSFDPIPRRIVALAPGPVREGGAVTLYALADDGTAWRLFDDTNQPTGAWQQLPDLPPSAARFVLTPEEFKREADERLTAMDTPEGDVSPSVMKSEVLAGKFLMDPISPEEDLPV